MSLRKTMSYGTAVAATALTLGGAVLIVDRVQYIRKTAPLEKQVYQMRKEIEETKGTLQKYTIHFADGRIATLNPDMSVTVSGINGERTLEMSPQEFKKIMK